MLENLLESQEHDLTQKEIEEMIVRSSYHISFYKIRLKAIQESLVLTEEERVKQANQIIKAIKRETNIIKAYQDN